MIKFKLSSSSLAVILLVGAAYAYAAKLNCPSLATLKPAVTHIDNNNFPLLREVDASYCEMQQMTSGSYDCYVASNAQTAQAQEWIAAVYSPAQKNDGSHMDLMNRPEVINLQTTQQDDNTCIGSITYTYGRVTVMMLHKNFVE